MAMMLDRPCPQQTNTTQMLLAALAGTMERQQKRAQLQQVQWQHYSVQAQPQYVAMTCMPEFGAVNPRFQAPGARGAAPPRTAAIRPVSQNDGLKVVCNPAELPWKIDLLGNGGSNGFEEVEQTSTDDGEEELHECTDEGDSDDQSMRSGPSSTGQTTLMIRNVPVMYTQELLLEEWPNDGTYDFLYLPRSGAGRWNLSYAFINFVSEAYAVKFKDQWQKKRLANFSSKKPLNISFAEVQGLEANLAQLKKKRVRWQSHFVIAPKDLS